MGKIRPIGSEKLEGLAKINRIMEIARYKENIPKPLNEDKSVEYTITLADGNTYRIDKERNGYVIKKGLNESTDYIEPMKNRKYYSSYSQAFKRLNLIAKEVNVNEGYDKNVSLFEGEDEEMKYYENDDEDYRKRALDEIVEHNRITQELIDLYNWWTIKRPIRVKNNPINRDDYPGEEEISFPEDDPNRPVIRNEYGDPIAYPMLFKSLILFLPVHFYLTRIQSKIPNQLRRGWQFYKSNQYGY
jgi:hypothetical protein